MPIKIVSKKDGFRRCGIPHPGEPTVYPDDRFSKDELDILKSEPMLVVTKIRKKKIAEDNIEVDNEEINEDDNGVDNEETTEDDKEIDDDQDEAADIDYSELSYNELKALAKKKNLKAAGSKKDLIKRLKKA